MHGPPQPGWYPDPWAQSWYRWWNGEAWTPSVHPRAGGRGRAAAAPRQPLVQPDRRARDPRRDVRLDPAHAGGGRQHRHRRRLARGRHRLRRALRSHGRRVDRPLAPARHRLAPTRLRVLDQGRRHRVGRARVHRSDGRAGRAAPLPLEPGRRSGPRTGPVHRLPRRGARGVRPRRARRRADRGGARVPGRAAARPDPCGRRTDRHRAPGAAVRRLPLRPQRRRLQPLLLRRCWRSSVWRRGSRPNAPAAWVRAWSRTSSTTSWRSCSWRPGPRPCCSCTCSEVRWGRPPLAALRRSCGTTARRGIWFPFGTPP